MATTTDQVKTWLRLADDVDDDLLQDVVAAANDWAGHLPWLQALTDVGTPWPVRADQGVTMLAARLYRRRNTPSGVEAFTDQVVYLPRRDSDVDMMLRVGSHAMPVTG